MGSGSHEDTSRKILLVLLLIVVIGTLLRVVTLSHEALEGDELFTRRVVELPMRLSYEAIRDDLVHPPLYYVLVKAGTAVWGSGALGVRVWSLVFGVALLPLVAVIGAVLPSARYAGLLAAGLLAVNWNMIFYSQEARSYSFYTFLVALFVLWISEVTKRKEEQQTWLWVAGCVLMTLLVYTHYVAAVYVFSAVLAILICNLPRQIKMLAVLIAVLAAVAFVPWVLAVAAVYQRQHGVGANLDWQGHPALYDLRALWAASITTLGLKGATFLVFLVVAVLSFAALKLMPRRQALRSEPVIAALALFAFLPPVVMFLLSKKPFDLPLFGLRHLLPSVVVTGLLCCYGLEALALRSGRFYDLTFATGGSILLILAVMPTLVNLAHPPSRYPYDSIAKDVRFQVEMGRSIYAAWFYGVGEPVNFYCGSNCVQPLPKDNSVLPEAIVLLYRPRASEETQQYQDLLKEGFAVVSNKYYTNGWRGHFGTSMVLLTRSRRN
jgi:4-amino-4-deoxy-L-arabinose transferase-like glycosyltransferase